MEMNNTFKQIALILRDSDILMKEIEHEYNTAIDNIRFDGEEEFLHQYYKKILTSVYRMRNNAAALLLRYKCTCKLSEDEIIIIIDDKTCTLSANAIKTILQDDYQKIMDKNKTDHPTSIVTLQKSDSVPVAELKENMPKEEIHAVTDSEEKKPTTDKVKSATILTPLVKSAVEEKRTIKLDDKIDIYKKDPKNLSAKKSQFEKQEEPSKADEPVFDLFDDMMLFDETHEVKAPDPYEKKYIIESEPAITKTEPETDQISADSIDEKEEDDILFGFDDMDDLDVAFGNGSQIEKAKIQKVDKMESPKEEEDISFFMDDEEKILEIRNPDHVPENEETIVPDDVLPIESESKIKKESETEQDDLFSFLDEEYAPSENSGKSKAASQESEISKTGMKFNDSVFDKNDSQMDKKSEKNIKPENGSKFNLSQKEFRRQEQEVKKPEEPAHKFTAEAISGDTQDLLEQLKKGRAAYDKEELERKLKDAQKVPLKGNVINLSTGNVKSGEIDAEKAIGKVSNVAKDIISASKKDRMMDAKLDGNTKSEKRAYEMQRDSDFVRTKNSFILDDCKIAIAVFEDGKIKSKDKVKLVIAPISIPETGTALVTDICAYMECNGEVHGAAVAPGKNSTLIIRGEDYTFLIRGSWENGDFKTAISIVGNGTEIKTKVEKNEIRPGSMTEVGIGHNVIYADHATIAHIIPVSSENEFGEYSNFMTVLVKDYGIDQDVDCKVLKDTPEMVIKGEKYRYAVSTSWDRDIIKVNFKTITR